MFAILSIAFLMFISIGNSYEMIANHNLNTDLLNNSNLSILFTISYTISSILMTMKWVNSVGNRLLIKISFFFLAVSFIFVSRESLFGLPKDLEYIVPGMVLGGIFNVIALITCVPELLVYGRQAAKEGTIE